MLDRVVARSSPFERHWGEAISNVSMVLGGRERGGVERVAYEHQAMNNVFDAIRSGQPLKGRDNGGSFWTVGVGGGTKEKRLRVAFFFLF